MPIITEDAERQRRTMTSAPYDAGDAPPATSYTVHLPTADQRIAAAIADARRGPVCRHGTPGGEALHPVSGEPLCPMCRYRQRLASLPTATPA